MVTHPRSPHDYSYVNVTYALSGNFTYPTNQEEASLMRKKKEKDDLLRAAKGHGDSAAHETHLGFCATTIIMIHHHLNRDKA